MHNTPLSVKGKTLAIFAPSVLLRPAMLISLSAAFSRNPCVFKKNPPLPFPRARSIAGRSKTDGAKMASVFSLTDGSGDFSTKKHEGFG